jgi:hypothetical protein
MLLVKQIKKQRDKKGGRPKDVKDPLSHLLNHKASISLILTALLL